MSFVKEIVAYSSLILLQMIATQLNSTVDQILIGSLVNSSAIILAVYGIGTQIVQYFQSIGSAFTGVLMPGVVKLVEKNGSSCEITDEMVRIGRIIFMILSLIWVAFLINGKEFIELWVGRNNSQAYIVASILMFAYMFTLTESIGSQILWAMNQHKEQAILKIVIVLVNIVLTVLLIRWNPLIGATIGTFISLILGDVVAMNIIFKKKMKISLKYYYKGIFKGILPCLCITMIIGFLFYKILPMGWIWFCIKVFIMALTYGVTMMIFGMTKYEKNLFSSMFKRIKIVGGK